MPAAASADERQATIELFNEGPVATRVDGLTFSENKAARDAARNPMGLPTYSAAQLISEQAWEPTRGYDYAGTDSGVTNWLNNAAASPAKNYLSDADVAWIRSDNGLTDPTEHTPGVLLAAGPGFTGLGGIDVRGGPSSFAAQGVEFGRLPGQQLTSFQRELGNFAQDIPKMPGNIVAGVAEAGMNLFWGAIPGSPDYVPYLDSLRAPYNSPMSPYAEFGLGLGSVVLSRANAQGIGNTATSGAESLVNGMRLDAQLTAEQAAGVRMPTQINGYSNHALEQIAGRDGGIGVSKSAMLDAWANPYKIDYVPSKFGPTFRLTGNDAVVVINQDGKVVTTWGTSSVGTKK